MLRSPPNTRRSQVAAYTSFIACGIGAAMFPSPSVETTAGSHFMLWLWVIFLVAGGLVSAFGRFLGRWAGEFVGLPLLAAAFAIYAVSLITTTITSGRLTGIPAGIALVAILFLVGGRWAEVNAIREEAVAEARALRGIQTPPAQDPLEPGRHRRLGDGDMP